MQDLIAPYNRFANLTFDAFLAPLQGLGSYAEILAVAAVLGIVVAMLFALLLCRERLQRARNDLWAALFEIGLYRHDPVLVLLAQRALLLANLRYIGTLLPPLIAALLIISPLLIQAHYRFALKPIPSDSDILLTALMAENASDFDHLNLKLEWVQGTGTVGPLVREPGRRRIVWRLRPQSSGHHLLHIGGRGQTVEFPLYVGEFSGSITSVRQAGGLEQLLLPRSVPLQPGSAFSRIYVDYPATAPMRMIWLTFFSLLFAFATNHIVRRYLNKRTR